MKILKSTTALALLAAAVSAFSQTQSHTWNNTVSATAFNGSYVQLRGLNLTPTQGPVIIEWKGYSTGSNSAFNVRIWDESGGGTGVLVYDSGDITPTGTSTSPGSYSRTVNLTAGRAYLVTINDHGYGSSSTFPWTSLYSTYTKYSY